MTLTGEALARLDTPSCETSLAGCGDVLLCATGVAHTFTPFRRGDVAAVRDCGGEVDLANTGGGDAGLTSVLTGESPRTDETRLVIGTLSNVLVGLATLNAPICRTEERILGGPTLLSRPLL